MKDLSISVAMATFNGARHLEEQLRDIAEQTVLPAELVVCDDGSTDGTLAILERFADNAPFPVRIYKNEDRLGYRANFIKCAGLCRSDLIAFCDQDDRWLPHKLEAVRAPFADPEVLLAFHPVEVFDGGESSLGRLAPPHWPVGNTGPMAGRPWVFSLGFTQVFRRWLSEFDRWWDLSYDQNTADERLAQDQWYFFLASTLGTVTHVDDILARYRQHGGNVYGWGGPRPSTRSLVSARVQWARSGLDCRARAARQRAEILDCMIEPLEPPYEARAEAGALAYRRLAEHCALRANIHNAARFGDRLGALIALVKKGGYGRSLWQFGPKAFAMDIAVGLPGMNREADNSGNAVGAPAA